MKPPGMPSENNDSVEEFLDVIRALDGSRRQVILKWVRKWTDEFYERLDEALPSWRDMMDWPDRDLQEVIRTVPRRQLAWALLGQTEEVLKRVGENMSGRGRKMLKEELDAIRGWRERKQEAGQVTPEELDEYGEQAKLDLRLAAERHRPNDRNEPGHPD